MRRLRDEILLTLVVGLVMAVALRNAAGALAGAEISEPLRTHPNPLLVAFTVYPDRPPTIEEVAVLPEGRITPFPPGENHLRLEARDGTILYTQAFAVSFFTTIHPPVELDRVELTVVLPNLSRADRVVVVTPPGEASAEIRW